MRAGIQQQDRIIGVGLVLLGLSLALSKSAGSVLLGLGYLYVFASFFFDKTLMRRAAGSLRQPLNTAILLYTGVIIAGLAFSRDLSEGLRVIKQSSNLFAVYLLVSVLIDSREDEGKRMAFAERALFFFVAGLFVLDMIGLSLYLGIAGSRKGVLPLNPLGMHHIWFGNINALGLYSAVSLLLFSRSRVRPAVKASAACFIPLGLVSALLSTSRTAWLGILCTTVLFAYLAARDKRFFFAAVTAIAAVCVCAYLFNGIVRERTNLIFSNISSFSSHDVSTSIGERFLMWKISVKMFLSNPVFGIGTGGYKSVMAKYFQPGVFPAEVLEYSHPHNMYLNALATNGLPGLAALVFLLMRAFRVALPLASSVGEHRVLGTAALLTTAHLAVAGLTESVFNVHALLVAFAFVMGVCERTSCVTGITQD
jgi:O-antigen ligase